MSFAGHVQQMIRSNADNAALRRSRKERMLRTRKIYASNGTKRALH